MTITTLIRLIRQRPKLLALAYGIRRWLSPLLQSPLRALPFYLRLFLERERYLRAGGKASLSDLYPCLFDRTAETKIDLQYFYQAAWAARQIAASGTGNHVDVGSDTKFVGMLTATTDVIFVDIRPLSVSLDRLTCRAGSVLALPFADESVSSLSSLHVIEHIGLGRYGDPIDPQGTRKACIELMRVLAPGGSLYLSTPIGRPRVQFNGQRVQSVAEVITNFPQLELVALAMIDPFGNFIPEVEAEKAEQIAQQPSGLDYALGCFRFVRVCAGGENV